MSNATCNQIMTMQNNNSFLRNYDNNHNIIHFTSNVEKYNSFNVKHKHTSCEVAKTEK